MPRSTGLLTMLAPRVLAQADRLHDGFLGAQPFAHCVIEDFFTDAFARTLVDAFPQPSNAATRSTKTASSRGNR